MTHPPFDTKSEGCSVTIQKEGVGLGLVSFDVGSGYRV